MTTAERLRKACEEVRRKDYPLSDLIPLMQRAADELSQGEQSKPLSDEQISSIWEGHTVPVFGKTGINPIVFARAIEQAHGIGKEQT
jgi:hypothetical protein